LKKRSKKLLFSGGFGNEDATSHRTKSFLVLFFKKEPLSSATTLGCWRGAKNHAKRRPVTGLTILSSIAAPKARQFNSTRRKVHFL
jgi:hypothetical protein